MKCTKCGAEIDNHAKFCGYCGNGIKKKKIELIDVCKIIAFICGGIFGLAISLIILFAIYKYDGMSKKDNNNGKNVINNTTAESKNNMYENNAYENNDTIVSDNTENDGIVTNIDYGMYADTIKHYATSEYGVYGYYYVYDMDNDGINEVILEYGTCSSDLQNLILYIEDNHVKSTIVEHGEYDYYVAPDGNGIYAVYAHMDHEMIYQYVKNVNGIVSNLITDRQIDMLNGEDYYTNDSPLDGYELNDLSGIYE
ncbi:MAG: zinc ribbon domain-containing protein [Lachnospiraceae bacterium]|nr:zinc ribbon domain-containing protein [Clostridiales bacterium]MDD6293867.1 zinc ribbon domain-containing protein [Eubacteriales bacterium]MDY2607238.1 zinc ribbon domain-containing protein [Lachnospiraceae bacterium]